jgi:hypothetical protein
MNETRGFAQFDSLNLNGNLYIRGQGDFRFPLQASAVTGAGAGAVITVNGGPGLAGNTGAATLNLAVQSNEPQAEFVIRNRQNLTCGGNILGKNGVIRVGGNFQLDGLLVEPDVQVLATGTFTVGGPGLRGSNLGIAAGARVMVSASNNAVFFNTIQSCPASATVAFKVRSSVAGDQGTILAYGAATVTRDFACTIQVYDDTGASVTLTRRVAPTSRRLLQSSQPQGQGTYEWQEGRLTYTINGGISAAAGLVPSLFTQLLAAVLALVAVVFML